MTVAKHGGRDARGPSNDGLHGRATASIRRMTLAKHGGRDARGPRNDGHGGRDARGPSNGGLDPLDVIGCASHQNRHAKACSRTRKTRTGTRKPRSSSFKSRTRLCSCTDVASDGFVMAFS